MQNKGAIKIFALLLTLACIFYLSFTWVTRSVEGEAAEYAESIVNGPKYQNFAKELSKGNVSKNQSIVDSLKSALVDRYLDSMKNEVVYDIFIASYSYSECKKNELNLGLDLRGGMNVTLEVSVNEIIRSLSNGSTDVDFNKALDETQKNLGVKNNDDFVTLFEKTYKQISPNGKLAPIFQTVENKDKISYNSSNDEVIAFIRAKVNESIGNAEKTFRSRIDRFGVTQPNIQKLEASGRILVELPGVKDKARVRELLQGTANLEFWETYENGEIAQLMDKANFAIRQQLFPESIVAVKDTTAAQLDSLGNPIAVNDSLGTNDSSVAKAPEPAVNPNDTALKNFIKRNPLYSMYSPLRPSIIFDEKGQPKQYAEGPVVGRSYTKDDTATVNKYLRLLKTKNIFPSKLKFMWSAKAIEQKDEAGKVVGTYYDLYLIKQTDAKGKAALSGDIITDARKDYDQRSGGVPLISMSMNSDAAQKWKTITGANKGKCIAIVM
ncbi:MAG: protein translocase subunit SecDF, partial [Bacteroidia bacterium]